MFDARIFINEIESARKILLDNNAQFKGEYEIHDYIYSCKDKTIGLDKVFLRLRLIPLNIWNDKSVVVAIKNTELSSIGKRSIIPLKVQFDNENEAREYIVSNLLNEFEFDYDFERKGWQYDLGNDQIDLEDIQGRYSIEFKSPSIDGLNRLLLKFNIKPDQVIKGPSVVEVKTRLRSVLQGN